MRASQVVPSLAFTPPVPFGGLEGSPEGETGLLVPPGFAGGADSSAASMMGMARVRDSTVPEKMLEPNLAVKCHEANWIVVAISPPKFANLGYLLPCCGLPALRQGGIHQPLHGPMCVFSF